VTAISTTTYGWINREAVEYLERGLQVGQCKKNLRENFACIAQSNTGIDRHEFKLTEDISKLIMESRNYQDIVNETSNDRQPGESEKVTYAELINCMNNLSKEIACFTFSTGHVFKQIVKIQRWMTFEEEFLKNFSLRVYEITLNLNFDKIGSIAECKLKSHNYLQLCVHAAGRKLPLIVCSRRAACFCHN
jgi:hypothetical protein